MAGKRQGNSPDEGKEVHMLNLPPHHGEPPPVLLEMPEENVAPAQAVLSYLKQHAILLLALAAFLYHQNSLLETRDREFREALRDREQQMVKMLETDKQRFLERETDLIRQRDELFRALREETAKNVQIVRVREPRWTRQD